MKYNNYKTKLGFTLVETLVALSIIMLGLMAAFGVAQLGISSSDSVRDRITAYFLAQESLEAVRSRRDHNLLLTDSGTQKYWLDGMMVVNGLEGPCAYPDGCDYDIKGSLADPTGNEHFLGCKEDAQANECTLKNVTNPLDATKTYYGYDGGPPKNNTKFTRAIFIHEFPNGVEASVRVQVTWTENGTSNDFETISYIFNWF